MVRYNSHEFVCFCGKAGYGKTSAIRELIKRVPDERLYIYDYNGIDYPNHPWRWLPDEQTPRDFETFINICYTKGNIVVLLEESDNYLDDKNDTHKRFFNTARNRGIGCIISCKRPVNSIRPAFRTRVNKYEMFHTDIPEDIRYLESLCGCGKGTLEVLKDLDIGEFYEFDTKSGVLSEKQYWPLPGKSKPKNRQKLVAEGSETVEKAKKKEQADMAKSRTLAAEQSADAKRIMSKHPEEAPER